MTTKVLLAHHHRDAIENAADRGFWTPLPLQAEQLKDMMYLTSLSYSEITLKQLVEAVPSFDPWLDEGGIARRLAAPQIEAVQIVELDALLAAEQLSDLLPGSGAACHLPRPRGCTTPLVGRRPAAVARGLAASRLPFAITFANSLNFWRTGCGRCALPCQLVTRPRLRSRPCCSPQAIRPWWSRTPRRR